jgi:cell division protein FtsN
MTADFKARGQRPDKKRLPGYVWLLSGLAIGLFVAFLVYLDKQPATEVSFGEAVKTELEKIRQHSQQARTTQPAQEAKSGTSREEPRFNFYTILPELEVMIPEDEIRPPPSAPASGTSNPQGKDKRYILQAGSFQNPHDAEKLKASLALLGLEANINKVSINNRDWHRVRIGPLDKHDLYRDLNLLQQNDVNAMAMELK